MSKTCTKCNLLKPLEEFSKITSTKDGHRTQCKLCINSTRNEAKQKFSNTIYKDEHYLQTTLKECKMCKVTMPVKGFHIFSGNSDGFKNTCITCTNILRKSDTNIFRQSMQNIVDIVNANNDDINQMTLDNLRERWQEQKGRCFFSGVPMDTSGEDWVMSYAKEKPDVSLTPGNLVIAAREFSKGWSVPKISELHDVMQHKNGFMTSISNVCNPLSPSSIYMRMMIEDALHKHNTILKHNGVTENFDVTVDDIIRVFAAQNGMCAISGMPLGFNQDNKGNWLTTILRVDEQKTFKKNNVILVCKEYNHQLNNINSKWTREKFETFYKAMTDQKLYERFMIPKRPCARQSDICEIQMCETLHSAIRTPVLTNLTISDDASIAETPPRETEPASSGAQSMKCNACKVSKPKSDFRKNPRLTSGTDRTCKTCLLKKERERNESLAGRLKTLVYGSKRNAIRKGEDMEGFDITLEGLMGLYEAQNGKCAISGKSLTMSGDDTISGMKKDRSLIYKIDNYMLVTQFESKRRS